jgi:hypothetical protein
VPSCNRIFARAGIKHENAITVKGGLPPLTVARLLQEDQMTESEWLSCTDPQKMLEFLRGKVSDRKLQLFAVACCRRIIDLLPKVCQKAVEVVEKHADGLLGPDKLRAMNQRIARIARRHRNLAPYAVLSATQLGPDRAFEAARSAATALSVVPVEGRWRAAVGGHLALLRNRKGHGKEGKSQERQRESQAMGASADALWTEYLHQADLLRDIIGNPFRAGAQDRSWLTSNVVAIAELIYDSRDYDSLPILADALEDAGCTDASILEHCRGGGVHVRGCWVVDLVLGRE